MTALPSLRTRLLRGSVAVVGGNVGSAALTLARNLLLAALLPIEDFGIVALVATTLALVEAASALGLPQQVVQARDGDDPRFQAGIHGAQVLRGALMAAILLAASAPLAALVERPEAAWGFAVLALFPLAGGFVHSDVWRMARTMRFGRQVPFHLAPPLLTLLAAWPAVAIWGDWRASIALSGVWTATQIAVSHGLAERPWRATFAPAALRRIVTFGWPLLLNSLLFAALLQGDRVLVAAWFDAAVLGAFAMGVTLTLTPALMTARMIDTLALPNLASVDRAAPDGEAVFARRVRALVAGVTAVAALYAALLPPAAALFIGTLFGADFAPVLPLLPLLAAVQAAQIWRSAAAVAALSQGRTGATLLLGLPRLAALGAAAVALAAGGSIETLLLLGLAAEAVSGGLALAVLHRGIALPLRPLLPFAAAGAVAVGAAAAGWTGPVLLVAVPAALAFARLWGGSAPHPHPILARRSGSVQGGTPA